MVGLFHAQIVGEVGCHRLDLNQIVGYPKPKQYVSSNLLIQNIPCLIISSHYARTGYGGIILKKLLCVLAVALAATIDFEDGTSGLSVVS